MKHRWKKIDPNKIMYPYNWNTQSCDWWQCKNCNIVKYLLTNGLKRYVRYSDRDMQVLDKISCSEERMRNILN